MKVGDSKHLHSQYEVGQYKSHGLLCLHSSTCSWLDTMESTVRIRSKGGLGAPPMANEKRPKVDVRMLSHNLTFSCRKANTRAETSAPPPSTAN